MCTVHAKVVGFDRKGEAASSSIPNLQPNGKQTPEMTKESSASSKVHQDGDSGVDSGLSRLHQLGYKQELKRDLSVLSNFAFSFSIISVLMGITTLYNTGLRYGGPLTMVYGWLVVSFFTMTVGLSMAEICSSYPTSGGLYYWSARLAGKEWAPFASWITGWFNIVGQWANAASVNFSLAQLLEVIILLSTGGTNGGGYVASKYVVIGFHAAILLSHALLNSLSITWLSILGQFAAAWNVMGVLLLMILIPLVATQKASADFVFTHFNTENDSGIHSRPYIFVLGLLMSQYTLAGYDASAHMTEETKDADKNGPKGIVGAIGISIVFGWAYLLGITFAVTDIPQLLSSENEAGGYAIAQVFYQAFKSRYGSGIGGIFCLGIVAVAIYFSGMSSVTSTSRMTYAFSRDGAMPLSSFWHKVDSREVPINAVWLSAFVSFAMALPSLGSLVAFQAMVSITTLGLYISYALPIFFRVTLARKSFVPGPFNLGRWGVAVGWVAVIWVGAITILFSLPVVYPVAPDKLNYTPVAVGGLLVIVLSWWFLSARLWFRGPVANISPVSRHSPI
ncbi:amino-acid permease BAT1 homolog [Wolffia australiana]